MSDGVGTVCPQGHEMTEANTHEALDGGTSCRACRLDWYLREEKKILERARRERRRVELDLEAFMSLIAEKKRVARNARRRARYAEKQARRV